MVPIFSLFLLGVGLWSLWILAEHIAPKIPMNLGLSWWFRWQRFCLQCRRPEFDLRVGRIPGEGNGYPLQYSCLKNYMMREPGGLQSMGSQRVGSNWPICQLSEYSFYKRKSLALHFLYPASYGLDCVGVEWTSFNHADELCILADGRTTRSGESGLQMAWWRIESLDDCFWTSSKRETNSLLFF